MVAIFSFIIAFIIVVITATTMTTMMTMVKMIMIMMMLITMMMITTTMTGEVQTHVQLHPYPLSLESLADIHHSPALCQVPAHIMTQVPTLLDKVCGGSAGQPYLATLSALADHAASAAA